MLREIRGVQQQGGGLRRWFQDEYFDLYVTQDREERVRWFQLCYARNTLRERVLEWRRGRGFLHLKQETRFDPVRQESDILVFDGVLPYLDVSTRFEAAAKGLPGDLAAFVAGKIREYARPDRRFRRAGAVTPKWLKRLRERERL